MSRLFVGVPITDEIKEKILPLMNELQGVRAVPPENLHFTLKFLGEADPEEVKRKLSSLICKKFTIKLQKVGSFPRVIWIGGSKELIPLMREVNQLLDHIRKNDYKEDIPHLTIARGSSPEFVNKHKDDQFGEMEVDKIVLYESTLTPEGPIYKVVEEFRLS